jgi:hypothetical protein
MQTGTAFIDQWRQLKTGGAKQQHLAIDRITRDVQRIFAYQQLEIDAAQSGQTLRLLVDGRSYWLPELGAGLAHFIMVLVTLALALPEYVLIDEPELNLHATLQLEFMNTLASYASTGVIFSTHSIGLARAVGDRILSIRPVSPGRSEVRPLQETTNYAELLGELSFSGYRDLGFGSVLLVEGPTDLRAMRELLRLYGKERDVLLLPLGGAGMIGQHGAEQLAEVTRLADRVLAVADSEKTEAGAAVPADRVAFVDVCTKLGIQCHVLERRALENYFSERAIKAVKGEKYVALEPYEKLSDVEPSWGKSENWRLARESSREEMDATDLGEFIRSL